MPAISKLKRDKITEQILHFLFTVAPESRFTSDIATEVARDEEFIKDMLNDLKNKKLVIEINKNSLGVDYKRRQRWRLSNEAHAAYQRQVTPRSVPTPLYEEGHSSF